MRGFLLFAGMIAAIGAVAVFQSPILALSILNLCLISAIMALGVNMQWGFAGIFNVGIMGFAALGGVAAVVVSLPPRPEAWSAGGLGLLSAGLSLAVAGFVTAQVRKRLPAGRWRSLLTVLVLIAGYVVARRFFDPAVDAIEAQNPAQFGNIGGLGLPIIVSWAVGGLFAAGAAWVVAKVALGLRSDYLAIATLGISEIILAVLKNEDWLARGVKNVSGLDRPVPYEVDLIERVWVQDWAMTLGWSVNEMAGVIVRGSYALLFVVVLVVLTWLAQTALASPWGRMMRAIRDNRDAAAAMGKDVTARHIQVFVLGSAVVGIAGAMLTTLEGQFTPGSYTPLRFTFLIWVMVIVGGSGNTYGSILGGFLIWFVWVQAEPAGLAFMQIVTAGMEDGSGLRAHLLDAAPHMRLFLMGIILLTVMRFSPRGLIPEEVRR
ncbi:MAG: branched-chain amino acid ABC transporter permease [Rubricella sp.]